MQNEFDYRKYLSLLAKHKRLFTIAALAVMTVAVIVCYILPKQYEAKSVVYVSRNMLNDIVRGMVVTPTVEETLRGLNSTISSRTLLTKVVNDLDLNLQNQSDSQLEGMLGSLRKRTSLQLDDREGLVTITFRDQNPRIARDYLNTLVRRYIEENLSTKREESYGAADFLSQQIASAKEKLDDADAKLNALRSAKGAALAADPVSTQSQIMEAERALADLAQRRSQLEAMRAHLKSNTPARARLNALQRRLGELRVEYTENYPEIKKVKADIETAQRELSGNAGSSGVMEPAELARVEAELGGIRMSEASQRAILARARGLMSANPSARTSVEKLEQERNTYREMYEQMVARHGQAEFSKQMEVQDKSTTFRIVEPAMMPPSPVSPNRMRIILIGIAAGLAVGFGLIMAIDYFDNTVKNIESLKQIGVKVLAVIPKINDPKAVEAEKQNDRRLFLVAGTYFGMIIVLLGLEIIGFSPVDRIIGLISG